MPDTPVTPGVTPETTPPFQGSGDQIQELMKRLLSRISQPRTQLQPPVPPEQPKRAEMMTGIAHTKDEGAQMFVHNLFGTIFNAVQQQKQQQLRHATGVLSQLNNSWQKAQDLAQGDNQKAMQLFSQLPEVTHILEDKKNVKQLGKLLQFDFMEPEKKKTVWHEALGKVVEAGKALGLTQAIGKLVGQHKQSQQQPPPDYAARERDASATAKQIAGMGVLQPSQMTVAQELKTMADTVKSERAQLNADRTAMDREKALQEKTDEFQARQKQQKEEFDEREALLKRREDALEQSRKDQVKLARERLDKSGANTDLRRIVTGLNYAPQLLKPGEAAAFGMQVDEDGNLVPLKSPQAATQQTKQAAQQAGVMNNLVNSTLSVLDSPDLANKLGPYSGRLSEIIQGKVGANVPEFDMLRTLGTFDASGMLKLHFGARGASAQYDKFKDLLNTGKMDLASLKESLAGFQTVIKAYKGEVRTTRDLPSAPSGVIVVKPEDMQHP